MKYQQFKSLFEKVEKNEINVEDAIKQIKQIKSQGGNAISPSDSVGIVNEYKCIPEIYVYNEPFLKDHTINGEQVVIGVTCVSLAINAFFKIFPQEDNIHLHKLNFNKPIEVKKDQIVEVRVEPEMIGPSIDFQVNYRFTTKDEWELSATGTLQKNFFDIKKIDIEALKNNFEELYNMDRIYDSPVIGLGDSFKTITHLYKGNDQVLARICLSKNHKEENHKYILHPVIINCAYLAIVPLLEQIEMGDGSLPFGIKDIYFHKSNGLETCWLLVQIEKTSEEIILFSADVINNDCEIIAHLSGCSLKRLHLKKQISAGDRFIPNLDESQKWTKETQYSVSSEVIEDISDLSAKIQKYLIHKIKKIKPDLSKISNLDINLMDMGFESSQLVAMADEIEKEINFELYPTLFFEYPSIKELTNYFFKEHKDLFAKLFGTNSTQKSIYKITQPIKNNPAKDEKEVQQSSNRTKSKPIFSDINSFKEPSIRDDIAVIGMHGLFPGASNLNLFWHNLITGKDLIKEVPIDHWDYREWYDENKEAKNKTYCKWGSFIDDVDKFDAGFFSISPREADWMDPQLRLLLQSIYSTAEDSGYINQIRGTNTGVFIGVCFHDYGDKIAELNLPVDPYMGLGNSETVIANRISFLFDFKGPSMAVNTACSSSLFALHYACLALRNKECDLAFVGGVNLLLSSFHYRYFCSIDALSPTGRCHSFDSTADGYVPGECIASVLLKPLRKAKEDGDHIYGIIKGSAALHGGHTPSLTAPSVAGEENVILKAWEDAGIDPETLTYIEAHGTGTKLGDPIEIESLKKAFKKFTRKEHFCAIGSAKSNIGHTEGAAGIAGLLKVILQMKYKLIPSMPYFKILNPYINLDKSPLYINQEPEQWKNIDGRPRLAGISSFGFSGAYAHVVIEEYNSGDRGSQVKGSKYNPMTVRLSAEGLSAEGDSKKNPSVIHGVQSCLAKSNFQIQNIISENEILQQTAEIEDLLSRLLWVQLQSFGVFKRKEFVKAELISKAGISDLYNRWLEESLRVLVRKNFITYESGKFTITDTNIVNKEITWEEWNKKKKVWLEDKNLKAQILLVESTLRVLPEILTGKIIATNIMFPNSSFELVEGIYKDNIISDYFNDTLSNAVVAYIEERLKNDPELRIRIIEIGAGTGATSREIFRKIKQYQKHIEEYCYTDISRAFLMHAKEKYGRENPYLTYKIINIELPIAEQDIIGSSYDLVIAANVLHATKNIRQTIRNVKAVLKENGLVILNDLNGNSLFNHLTFGLLEGWWLYEDEEIRIPGCPAVSSKNWQKVLEGEGFRSVFFHILNPVKQQIIISESDGVIPQNKENSIEGYKKFDKSRDMVKEFDKDICDEESEESIDASSIVKSQIIVFSARNQDRLYAVVQQILDYIEGRKGISLTNLAYTLQFAREAMEFRLAIVACSKEELIKGMRAYLESVQDGREIETSIPIYIGNLEDENSDMKTLFSGKSGEVFLQTLFAENNLEKLALHWTKGGNIPWRLLYNGDELHKITLPTYPFAKVRHWITEHDEESASKVRTEKKEITVDTKRSAQEHIQKYIVQYFSELMNIGIDRIKLDRNILDYGVDSIVILKLIRDFEKRFQIKITSREVLEYKTIKSLSAYLAKKNNVADSNEEKYSAGLQAEIIQQTNTNMGSDPEIEMLEKFRKGMLTIDEIEILLDDEQMQ